VKELSLICESCGYDLSATLEEGRCPECGRPVGESLPAHRGGTAWQRAPGLFSWALTCKRVLFNPAPEFARLSLARRGTGLLALNCLLAGTLIASPWTGVFIGDWSRTARGTAYETIAYLSAAGAQSIFATVVLLALTLLITAVSLAFARSRQWRLTRRAAWNVACHASAAWLVAGVMPLLLMAVWYTLGTLLRISIPGTVPGSTGGMQVSWQTVLGAAAPISGLALGAWVFLSRMLAGVRACRYATLPQGV
jgi:hypothetical protein